MRTICLFGKSKKKDFVLILQQTVDDCVLACSLLDCQLTNSHVCGTVLSHGSQRFLNLSLETCQTFFASGCDAFCQDFGKIMCNFWLGGFSQQQQGTVIFCECLNLQHHGKKMKLLHCNQSHVPCPATVAGSKQDWTNQSKPFHKLTELIHPHSVL